MTRQLNGLHHQLVSMARKAEEAKLVVVPTFTAPPTLVLQAPEKPRLLYGRVPDSCVFQGRKEIQWVE